VEDTFPNIAYAFEPAEDDVMKRRPNPKNVSLLTKEMKVLIFGTGIIDQLLILILFWFLWSYLGLDLNYARTMVFGALCLDTAFVSFSYKNLRKNIWQTNILNNKLLLLSSVLVFLAFAAAIYIPFLQKILKTVPLDLTSWLILTFVGIMSLLLVEITKWFFIVRNQTER
jgi:Ca2+-transporting ATPase